MRALALVAIVAPVSVLAGATVLCVLAFGWAGTYELLQRLRARHVRHRAGDPLDDVEDAYVDARHAMNEAAGQSWRNLVD